MSTYTNLSDDLLNYRVGHLLSMPVQYDDAVDKHAVAMRQLRAGEHLYAAINKGGTWTVVCADDKKSFDELYNQFLEGKGSAWALYGLTQDEHRAVLGFPS